MYKTAVYLSTEILDQARAARYSQFEVQRGMPIMMLVKYFTQTGDTWTLKDEIRGQIRFETLNLLDSFAHMGTFDVIFCRNVLIYFDRPLQDRALGLLHASLARRGFLGLAPKESLRFTAVADAFVEVVPQARIYRKL